MAGDDGTRSTSERTDPPGSFTRGRGNYYLVEGTEPDGTVTTDEINCRKRDQAKFAFKEKHGWNRFETVTVVEKLSDHD